MIIKKIKWYSLIFTLFVLQSQTFAQKADLKRVMDEAFGGKAKWEENNYILFSAIGNNKDNKLVDKRTFLINKSNGEARFEGSSSDNDDIVLLFNFKDRSIKSIYINSEKIKDSNPVQAPLFRSVLVQFNEDANLLFSPILLETSIPNGSDYEQKIINSQKMALVKLDRFIGFDGRTHSCSAMINIDNGQLKGLRLHNTQEYWVNGYKDIGGGLILPTQFDDTRNSSQSCKFTTVASFTDIEDSKFDIL